MPKQYEAMRDRFRREGLSLKEAKAKAARIYNRRHPDSPVTGKHKKQRHVLGERRTKPAK